MAWIVYIESGTTSYKDVQNRAGYIWPVRETKSDEVGFATQRALAKTRLLYPRGAIEGNPAMDLKLFTQIAHNTAVIASVAALKFSLLRKESVEIERFL